MPMRTCDLFDKYRDRELGSVDRGEFESHLAACDDCRMKMSLLNNLVHVLKQEELRPMDLANQIARQAFLKRESWSSLVVSWLRPGPAWAAVSLILALFAFLFLMPGTKQLDIYSEYEKLMDEAEAVTLSTNTSLSQAKSDMDLILWLEQEEESQ